MKNTKYILAGLLIGMAMSVSARTYLNGEKIYVNVNQSFNWADANAKLYVYVFQSWDSGNQWAELTQVAGNVYEATITTSDGEAYYDKIIIVRKDPAKPNPDFNDGGVWTKTCDTEIPMSLECNYLFSFQPSTDDPCNPSQKWYAYAPPADKIASYASSQSAEKISVCPEAAGDPFSLKAKLKTTGTETDYDYSNVVCHAWYASADKTTWVCVDGWANNPRDGEHAVDTLTFLPASLSTIGADYYYYLHSANPAGRRLVHIKADATKCALDCDITAFETAVSAVNADDNTYTLDGMVAFGEANGKQLVIECDGSLFIIDDPHSPQSFSLPGLPAATTDGITTQATAYFRDGVGAHSCEQSITINVPNAKEAVAVKKIDVLTATTIELKPTDCDPNNEYVWIINGVEYKKGAPGVQQQWTIPNALIPEEIIKDSSFTCVYKEYLPAPGSMSDLMDNGSYENTSGYESVSQYDYWGIFPQTETTQIDFYNNTEVNPGLAHKNNGFAVVRNAHNFAPSYAKVTARDGMNFGLFDAVTGTSGGDKMAWYAATAQNNKLKLKQGTTYVLSFWAANINNYGEMDNAASFVFRILDNTNGGAIIGNSDTLNLGEPQFRNNLWHQCSKTFLATKDYDDITIAVVNLNTKAKPGVGNDFALDDIQFHPISVVSKVVKSEQQFDVTVHEPKVDDFTATVLPVECDEQQYKVALHVVYQNPNGKLSVRNITRNESKEYTLPSVAFDTPAVLDDTVIITTDEPSLNWDAYFLNWTTAKKSASTVIPGFPAIDTANVVFMPITCDDILASLMFDLDYTYQHGKLHYAVVGLAGDSVVSSVTLDKNKQSLSSLPFKGIPADGKARQLHVWFDGEHSCDTTYNLPAGPFTHHIDTVIVSNVPATVLCDAQSFTATVTIQTPYDASGMQLKLTYDDNGAKDTVFTATGTSTTVDIVLHTIGGGNQVFTASYVDAPACVKPCEPFKTPTRFSCIKDEAVICEGSKYTWERHNKTYSASELPLGVDTFVIDYDSLIVTVKAIPAISWAAIDMACDSEATVVLPFTVENGNPDSVSVLIDSKPYSASVVGTDIVIQRGDLTAGSYTATVSVGEAGSPCATQQTVSFTIAAANQMYRKWSDVLFVNNKDGRYTAYQWYENGLAMTGETQQRLYNPGGMTGIYYCRMTTTDGKTIFTCPQAFNDVKPSNQENTTPSVPQIRAVYDTMGRPVNGQPTNGIYILVEEIEGELITTKIIVND